MSFVQDLNEIAEKQAPTQAARLHAHSIATSIVVGLMAAKMEELHPGSREQLLSSVDAIVANISAADGTSPAIVEEVAKHARTILNTSNT